MAVKRRHRRNINEPGHAHELTFSCYRGFKFLTKERTRRWLADTIEAARERYRFDVWAYVVMPEHVHLIVRPREVEYDIAVIRRAIKGPVGSAAFAYLERYAPHWLPRLTRTRGKKTERLFWQSGGGYDRNVVEPGTLLSMIAYVHANPVRRGLCGRPGDWEWSSAGWYERTEPGPIAIDPIPPEWTLI